MHSTVDSPTHRNAPAATAQGFMTRERLKGLVLLAATAAAAWLCFKFIEPFLPAVTWALALAVLGYPLHRRIASYCPPAVAAVVSVVAVALILAGPIAFVSYHLVAQTRAAEVDLDEIQEKAIERPVEILANSNDRVRPAVEWIRSRVDLEKELLAAVAWISRSTPTFVNGVAWIVMQTLIMILILFYLFRDGSTLLQGARRSLPMTVEESEGLFRRIDHTIHAVLFGSLFTAAIQGTMGGLMFWWLGLPAPLLWGVVMSLLAVIPNLGTFVIWAPAAGLLMLQGHWTKALALIAWGSCAIGLIDNLLYPVLVGGRLQMHPLLVFFAVLGGLSVLGVSGIVLGPVTVAVLLGLIDLWRARTAGGAAADDSSQSRPNGEHMKVKTSAT